jgi:hypothetical protein
VGNLADVFGTALGIALTRSHVPVLPAFAALTLGHLYSSWREVKAFELPYLNRTRLAYTARRFLATGALRPLQIIVRARHEQVSISCEDAARTKSASDEQELCISTMAVCRRAVRAGSMAGATSGQLLVGVLRMPHESIAPAPLRNVTSHILCAAGEMATVREANAAEPLRFWGGGAVQGRVVLGAAVRQACPGADDLANALSVYDGEAFAVTYRRAAASIRCLSWAWRRSAGGDGLCG